MSDGTEWLMAESEIGHLEEQIGHLEQQIEALLNQVKNQKLSEQIEEAQRSVPDLSELAKERKRLEEVDRSNAEKSDGSTASYYELPEGAAEIQDLISYRDLNGQIAEIFRACYRYGLCSHSDRMRDAKKIKFYAEAEIKRLEKHMGL